MVDIISIKEKIIRPLLWIAVVLWMGLIFMFSAQTAEDSSETSRTAADVIMELLGIENAEEILENEEVYGVIDFTIRKSAHFCIFAVLGALLTVSFSRYFNSGRLRYPFVSFLFGVLYAISDEVHQYFVPGRACQLRDVCIDSAGVLFGCAAVYLIMRLMLRRKTHTIR